MTMKVNVARLGEGMLFTALQLYRISPDHEVFDIPSVEVLRRAFGCVRNAFAALADMPVSSLVPSDPHIELSDRIIRLDVGAETES